MVKVTGLMKRGNTFTLRRRVPADLVAVNRKTEIWVSLGTPDVKKAAIEARRVAYRLDLEWEEQRKAVKAGQPIKPMGVISEQDIRRAVLGNFWQDQQGQTALCGDEARENFEREIAGLEMRDPSAEAALFAEAITVVNSQGLNIELPPAFVMGETAKPFSPSPELLLLVEVLRRSNLELLKRGMDRVAGGHGDTSHDPLFAGVTSTSPKPSNVTGVTLGEAIKRFETDPMRARHGATALKKYVVPFRVMKEVIGENRPIAEITRSDCAYAQELISGLPSNLTKYRAYDRCKTLREVVTLAADRKTEELLSGGTQKVYSQRISSFLGWALNKGLVASNPAVGISTKNLKSEKRKTFNIDQLNAVLAGLPEWSERGKLGGRYWVFLISLFSGMRLGEVATLTVDDFALRDGVQFFELYETDERGLKTANSERVIPVHPDLIKLGLLQRVANLRKSGERKLFPDLPGKGQKHIASMLSKRFAYYFKTTLDLDIDGLVFHSTRHNFRDALRRAEVPHDTSVALGGWSPATTDGRYGNASMADMPKTLSKWMKRVSYPGLILPSPIDF